MDYHHYREALASSLAQRELPFPPLSIKRALKTCATPWRSASWTRCCSPTPPISII